MARSDAPSSVSPGSKVASAPRASATRRTWVDLPQPSTPSKAMKRPRAVTSVAARRAVSSTFARPSLGVASADFGRRRALGRRLLRRRLLGGGLLRRRLLRAPAFLAAAFFAVFFDARARVGRVDGPAVATVLQELGGALDGDRVGVVARAQRGVRLAVGHVRAEPALAQRHRLARRRVVAELAQRRRRGTPPPGLRLGEQRERLVERDGEQRRLVGQRARLGRRP